MTFKKARARRMYEVYLTGNPFEQGNHRIEIQDGKVIFHYRGTPIMAYDLRERTREKLNAGAFEETPSTRNQRKQIHEAIDEFELQLFGEVFGREHCEQTM